MKIRGEQDELDKERDELDRTLKSAARLKTLIKTEILADADTYGDERRTQIVEREAAQALKQEDLVPSEPVSIVLSKSGWARLAKGHEIDPVSLNYRAGDEYQHSAHGRSNEQAVFLDESGRAYALPAHSLPSARGLGEPLSSRFTPPDGSSFIYCLAGSADKKILLASSFGYGFVTQLENLYSRMKAGKAMISLPAGAVPLAPAEIDPDTSSTVVCVSSDGYLLAFPLKEVPELAKGKGNKLINIPPKRLKAGDEHITGLIVMSEKDEILVWAGQRYLRMGEKDIDHFRGDRAQRGRKLPRGFQRVTRIERAID